MSMSYQTQPHLAQQAFTAFRYATGVVIPVYFPDGIDAATGAALLRDTVWTYCQQIANPAAICLSVDGNSCGERIAAQLAAEFGASLCVSAENRGKLHGVTAGMRLLLRQDGLAYFAVVDQDGDHFANELLNFLRAAQHIETALNTPRIMLTGRRVSRHRSMGLLRGELEELCDRMLFDALHYRAVVAQRPLRLEYVSSLEEFPDFHSGFHLFSRPVAEAVFLSEPQMMGLSEASYYRHACDAVMVVEALECGAYFGVVNRSAFNAQPISTFGRLNRVELAADMIVWPCQRLGIPLPFVEQWFANHLPRLLLNTLAPQGKDELEAIRRRVIHALAADPNRRIDQIFEPLFL